MRLSGLAPDHYGSKYGRVILTVGHFARDRFTVPANATAWLSLYAISLAAIPENGKSVVQAVKKGKIHSCIWKL